MTSTLDEVQSLYDRMFDVIFEMKNYPDLDDKRANMQTKLTELRKILESKREEEQEIKYQMLIDKRSKNSKRFNPSTDCRLVYRKEEYKTRNINIYNDRKNGLPISKICEKHNLTETRIIQIIKKEHHRRMKSQNKPCKGRVIDMGGLRDVDQVWTPEMQAKEFGLI